VSVLSAKECNAEIQKVLIKDRVLKAREKIPL